MAEYKRKYKQGLCMYCGKKIPIRKGRLYAWCNEKHRTYFYQRNKLNRINSEYTIVSYAIKLLREMNENES